MNMKNLVLRINVISIFLTVGLLTCCKKNEPMTTPISPLKLLWNMPIEGGTDDYKRIDIDDDVVYNNGVVISHFIDGKRSLRMIDLETKQTRWVWSEGTPLAFDIHRQYQYGKYLVVGRQNKVYCIDLEIGKSVFNNLKNVYFDNWSSGIGNTLFISSYTYGQDSELYKGDIKTGEIVKFLTPKYKKDTITNGTATRLIYKTSSIMYEGDSLLVVPFIESKKNGYTYPQLNTYNVSKGKWLYDNIDLVLDTTFYKTMPNGVKIHNNNIYIACGYDLICYELLTGKEKWRRNDFLHYFAFAFHGFEVFDNKLVTSTEEGKTYCIDTQTGKNIWVIDKVGSPDSFIRYHNGILYYLAGAQLRCVDIQTGELLASISNPDDSYIQERVVVVPQPNGEKAKVIIFSYKNMYVYEAIR
jgi:outer membrane protein assembly factor BamB